MKREMSSVQLHFMVRELQSFVGARVDGIFHSSRGSLILQLYRTGAGKVSLYTGPKLLYALPGTHRAGATPFAQKARKHLKNAILRTIAQAGSERLVELGLSQQGAQFSIFVELFSRGNLILCDAQGIVLAASSYPKGTSRDILVGKPYVAPPSFDAFSLRIEELSSLLAASLHDSLVKALAKDLGVGGIYAEELCLRAGLDKNKKPQELPGTDIAALHAALKAILAQKMQPVLVEKDRVVVDAQPIALERYKAWAVRSAASFSEALSELAQSEPVLSSGEKRVEKIRERLRLQEEQLAVLEKSIVENTRIGNTIYEHYSDISLLLGLALRYRKSKDTKLLRQIKAHKFFESLDEKSGTLTLQVQ